MPATETYAVTLAAETGTALEENELPVPAIWFGVFSLVVFMLLLAITYSFRTVAHVK